MCKGGEVVTKQNDMERLKDQMERGLITAAEANVQKVRNERFLLVTHLPRDVRSALNAAVRAGTLGHIKKEHLKPEVYFHPTFEYLAVAARNEYYRRAIRNLRSMFVINE